MTARPPACSFQADHVDKAQLIQALAIRGITVDPLCRRWLAIDEIRKWALTYLPPEARMAKLAEMNWLPEVEELGWCARSCGVLSDHVA